MSNTLSKNTHYLGDWYANIGINNRINDAIDLSKKLEQRRTIYIIANFGGPRNKDEIYPFLRDLLCDQDVIRTPFPKIIHRAIFSLIAYYRSFYKIREYDLIGGKSPIYEQTETLITQIKEHTNMEIFSFHRYNTNNHNAHTVR